MFLREAFSLTSDGDMYISIQIVHKVFFFLWCVKILIVVIYYNHFISYILLYAQLYTKYYIFCYILSIYIP